MKTEVEIDFEIPEGYKVKRIGLPKEGDLYIDSGKNLNVERARYGLDHVICVIVEKCPKWRRVTPIELLDAMMFIKQHKLRYWQGGMTYAPYSIISLEPAYVMLEDMPRKPLRVKYSDIEILVEE